MKVMIWFLRAFTVSVGITPPPPEKEKLVATIVFFVFCGLVAIMVAFGFAMLHLMASGNMSR